MIRQGSRLWLTAYGTVIGLRVEISAGHMPIGLMFSVVLTPMLFTSCSYFPWAMLNRVRWFQVITCINPITYSSEGFRAALVPWMPHMPVWFIIVGQLGFLALFSYVGIRGFLRKALD